MSAITENASNHRSQSPGNVLNSGEKDKSHGVTHTIRERLNFLDERLWKRFSARRLELIDTLELSTRKASEQELEISNVADTLRIEFGFGPDSFSDFDRLVRAAVQSVRRNRKRATKSKRNLRDDTYKEQNKKIKKDLESNTLSPEDPLTVDPVSVAATAPYVLNDSLSSKNQNHDNTAEQLSKYKFMSEICKLNSDSQDEKSDYSKTKHFTVQDKSREAINAIIQPRLTKLTPSQPSPSYDLRPKTSAPTLPPLVVFGLNDETAVTTLYTLIGGCIKDFGFETIMYTLCEAFYQRLTQDYPLISKHSIPFKSYNYLYNKPPLNDNKNNITQNDHLPDSLTSLAEVASELQDQLKHQHNFGTITPVASQSSQQSPLPPDSVSSSTRSSFLKGGARKAVFLKFLSQQLEFSYPTSNSAPPKLLELLENAKSAFKLTNSNDSRILGLKNLKTGQILSSDSDLEKIFKTNDNHIELEIFTQSFKAIPIYEITSAIIPSRKYNDDSPKIILPPPINNASPPIPPPNSTTIKTPLDSIVRPEGGLRFLSNQEDLPPSRPPPPPAAAALLPKFQPLL
ncbi:hypothetical protein QCA50_009947 [Cerrena zonata]|uniref:Uncharacterized protein n=1 Tax=Cerrena zonata TaxID=2478898 RepID=A0AAW0G0W9_9APHY